LFQLAVNNDTIVVAGSDPDRLYVYRLGESLSIVQRIKLGGGDRPYAVAFSTCGSLLAVGSATGHCLVLSSLSDFL
jgi:hypothetical protein